jgi:acetyl/propionyl-CoA carboxylase alpha subunit
MQTKRFVLVKRLQVNRIYAEIKLLKFVKNLVLMPVHPGYGFLSENSAFAEECEKNNIIFIGPKSKAIEMMGSKLAAKEAVMKYDIPMVPGVDHAITDLEEAKKTAKEVGFPILIKASAGGGGKGMRIVEKEEDFESQMNRAISEALLLLVMVPFLLRNM